MVSAQIGLAGLALLPFALGKPGFQLYPLVPPQPMAEMLGISQTCVEALNTTLPCDENIFKWAVKVDDVYWTQQDVSTLCVPECQSQAHAWTQTVASACAEDWLVVGDRAVPAETLSLRFVEGLDIACMRDTSQQWCLLESYEWTGSDVVQVDCAADPSDPWCVNPANVSAANSRISTLYDDDLLCSECFLQMMYARVTSEFLPDTDHSDYLVGEFQDIQSVCQTSVGPVATRAVPLYPYASELQQLNSSAPEPTDVPVVGDDGSPWDPEGDVDEDPVDLGEEDLPAPEPPAEDEEPEPEEPEPQAPANCTARAIDVRYASAEGLDACNELAGQYSVATGELVYATANDDCYSMDLVCVPEACQLLRVSAGDTCQTISEAISNATDPVSVAQLMTWNPNMMGACDHPTESQYLCISRPGGSWSQPPPDKVPENSNGPVRGGPGSTTSLPIIDDPSSVPTDRVQEGVPAECSRYVKADVTTASCWKMAIDAHISQNRLFELNPALGAAGEHCQTQIWLGYYYCVAVPGDGSEAPSPTTTTQAPPAATTTGSSAPSPSPQHEGTDVDCYKWVQAVAGDGCWKLANDAGIDESLFYKWNPVLGASGENCGSMMWPDYYYCVGVRPKPQHEGTDANCNKWVKAVSGDGCWKLANDAGVKESLFYKWNPVLGASGENCGSMMWPDYYYCVGVASRAGSPPAATTTTAAPPKPTATQEGIPENCTKFAEARSGGSCWQLANDNGIELARLYALNPVLGSQGENCGTKFWPDTFYCIGTD